jgi:NADH-quinone oxidoreductase subunit I
MTWLERIYLWNIAKGMLITLSHLFKKKQRSNTLSKKEVFQKYSRLQVLNRDEEGRER